MAGVKQKLIVFAGKPGTGKSTFIRELFPNANKIDVQPFIMKYTDQYPEVPEEKKLDGYRKMYSSLERNNSDVIVMELGTNYPEFNVKKLSQLQKFRDIFIVICDAPNDVCRQRVKKRLSEWDGKWVEQSLSRNFPNSYVEELEKTELRYKIVDTSGDKRENTQRIKNLIS